MADRSRKSDRHSDDTKLIEEMRKRMKIEEKRLEQIGIKDDEIMRKTLALNRAFSIDKGNLVSAMRFLEVEEFCEEKYVLFHSTMITSMVRLLQDRPMPIDILRIFFRTTKDLQDFDFLTQPIAYYMDFKGFSTRVLEQLRDDVKFDLDYISRAESTTGIMRQCWEALMAVCEGELAESKIQESGDLNAIEEYDAQRRKLHSTSYRGLEHLQWEIESEMPLLPSTVMSTKNQHLYQLIQFFKAKVFLKENRGCQILGKRLILENTEALNYESSFEVFRGRVDELVASFVYCDEPTERKLRSAMFGYHDKDEYQRFSDRASIAMTAAGNSGSHDRSFNTCIFPPRMDYEWSHRYPPVSPMYFNRVEYGRILDSYNLDEIHAYVVKGYKFNIFYPDLVDKRNLQFFIEYKKGNTETCKIRFQAGPPYQDVTFQIVNREWDVNGFKCTFDQGILHFYFNLKGYGIVTNLLFSLLLISNSVLCYVLRKLCDLLVVESNFHCSSKTILGYCN